MQIAQLELANIKAVQGFAGEHNIDCDVHPCDTIDVIYDAAQWTQAQEAVAAMRAAMPDGDEAATYRLCDADEVRERCRTCSPQLHRAEAAQRPCILKLLSVG